MMIQLPCGESGDGFSVQLSSGVALEELAQFTLPVGMAELLADSLCC